MTKRLRLKRSIPRVVAGLSVAALALAGCSANDGGEVAGGEPIVLEFPSWQANEPGNADVFQAVIDEFEATHPGVTVNLYHVPAEDYTSTVLTQLQAGTPPDIIPMATSHYAPFVDSGLIEPIGSRLEESGLLDVWGRGQDAREVDGEHYALELQSLVRLLHYNTDILAQAGISEPPSTPEELRAAVGAINAAGLTDVSGWGATTTTHPNLTSELNSFILGHGGAFTRDGEWTLLEPEAIEAAELYRELASSAPPGLTGAQYRQLMADQHIGLANDGNWVMAFFDANAAAENRDKLKIVPSPFEQSVLLMGTGLGMPTDISDERKELVWEFIETAAQPEFQRLWAELLYAVPGRADVLTDEVIGDNETLRTIADAAATAVSEWPDSANYFAKFGEIDLAVQDAVMRMLTTDEPTRSILESLQEELAAITEP